MPTTRMVDRLIEAAVSAIAERVTAPGPDDPLPALIEDLAAKFSVSRRDGTYLQIEPGQWQPCAVDDIEGAGCEPGDDLARLSTTVSINGVAHHLEGWQVIPGSDPQQLVTYPEDLDRLDLISASDGPFATVEIDGHEYVLVAFPHR